MQSQLHGIYAAKAQAKSTRGERLDGIKFCLQLDLVKLDAARFPYQRMGMSVYNMSAPDYAGKQKKCQDAIFFIQKYVLDILKL